MTIAAYVQAHGLIARGQAGNHVKAVQLALRAAGHQLLADGNFGGITELAVRRFQAPYGFEPDGKVGPLTAALLDSQIAVPSKNAVEPALPSSLAVAPWLSIARSLTGTREIAGARNNPLILQWVREIVDAYPDLKNTVGWYGEDSTPWCGLFIGYCVAKSGHRPPTMMLGAANWARDWADGVALREPALGCIMVMTRTGGGHVTFYEGEDDSYYFGRGGNQSDTVNVSRFPKSRNYLGFMWPKSAATPALGRHRTSFDVAVSESES